MSVDACSSKVVGTSSVMLDSTLVLYTQQHKLTNWM
jgi:hypothetical protein